MNIIEAIRDENLFRSFLADKDDSIASWSRWFVALRCLYGLPIHPRHYPLIQQCTGRDPTKLPKDGFDVALMLCGRRSGKSRIAALCAAASAVLGDYSDKLAAGESGICAVMAPTRKQSKILLDYLSAAFNAPMLAQMVTRRTREGFDLSNGNSISIISGDHKVARGFSYVNCTVDEMAFFGVDQEAKLRSDSELVRGIEPGLATTGGKLIAITSPYARKGWCWDTYQRNFGNDNGRVLVWNAPSLVMNPATLDPARVAARIEEDLQAAKSEYLGEFRDDVAAFVGRAAIEKLVIKGRTEIVPLPGRKYHAFVDMAGGVSEKSDDAALAIAHVEHDIIVLDLLARYKPPFSPYAVIRSMVETLNRYGITSVVGDRFSPGFVAQTFAGHRIRYQQATADKSTLYAELLPRLGSGQIQLLDNDVSIQQLCSLERRTRSGGKDTIDHPRGQHDDLANVLAGVVQMCARPVLRVGALGGGGESNRLSRLISSMQE